jgi:hypothetical protein
MQASVGVGGGGRGGGGGGGGELAELREFPSIPIPSGTFKWAFVDDQTDTGPAQ